MDSGSNKFDTFAVGGVEGGMFDRRLLGAQVAVLRDTADNLAEDTPDRAALEGVLDVLDTMAWIARREAGDGSGADFAWLAGESDAVKLEELKRLSEAAVNGGVEEMVW